MAEIFGTAASAIGIAGFAVQIAETALKLKNLWCFVRDAPEDIQFMIEDVESFNEILSEIQMQTVANHVPTIDSSVSDKCIERCAQASAKLSAALLLLEAATKKSPVRGGFRVKLKEGTLLKLRSQLEIAKNCMWLARHNHCSALDGYEHSILDSRLSLLHHDLLRLETKISPALSNTTTIVDVSSRSCGNTKNIYSRPSDDIEHNDSMEVAMEPVHYQSRPPERDTTILLQNLTLGTKNSWLFYFMGSIEYKKLRFQSKLVQNSESSSLFVEHNMIARWRLPFWLANISWETCLKRTNFGWEMFMHVDHVIPRGSPALNHIETGNVAALQVMLSRREITPNSYFTIKRNNGQTNLLSYAIHSAQPEVCELLISLGANSIEFRSGGSDLLAYTIACTSRKPPQLRSKYNQIIRLLLEKGNADPDMPNYFSPSSKNGALSLAVHWGFAENIFLLQAHSYPPFHNRSLVEKFDAAWTPGIQGDVKLENLRLLLGWESINFESAHSNFGDEILKDVKRSRKLLRYFARNLGNALGSQHQNPVNEALSYFIQMVREWRLRWSNSEIIATLSMLLSEFVFALFNDVSDSSSEKSDYRQRLLPRGLKGTPICGFSIFKYRTTFGAIDISTVVQTWVKALRCAGMTESILGNFCHYFPGGIRHGPWSTYLADRQDDWSKVQVRIISFRSGPHVSDWGACLSDPMADTIAFFFGEFWYMVENPWMYIPGAWFGGDRDMDRIGI